MKKKLITGILALSMCFAATGCDLFGGNSGGKSEDLTAAAEYITGFYKDDANTSNRVDYDVMSSVTIDEVVYNVTWSVNVTEGVKVVVENNKTTIDVSETLTSDLNYVLTGTITAPSGKTTTITFNRTVKAAPVMVSAPIQSAPVEGTAYKLYVYQSNSKQDCYFSGKVASTYYLGSVQDYESSPDIYVEKVGDTNTFYYTFTNADGVKQYVGIVEQWNQKNSYWTFNTKIDSKPVSAFEYNAEYGIMVSKIRARSDADNKNQEAEPSVDAYAYLGCNGTFTTISAYPISKLNTNNYFSGTLIGLVDRNSVSAEYKISETVKGLSFNAVYVGANELELATQGTTYPDVTVTWTATGATLSGKTLTIAAPTASTDITLKATVAVDGKSEDVTFSIKSIPNETAAIIEAAKTLKDGESFANTVELEGKITAIKTAYDTEHKNLTITMDVNGTAIDAYRLAGNGADVLAEGYTVKVKGILTNYKGTVQFNSGCEIVSYQEGAPEETEDPMKPGEGETLISKTMADLATAAGNWDSSANVAANAVKLDEVASFTIAGGANSGKYYGHIRVYATDDPAGSITVSVKEGYTLVAVRIETVEGTYAFLQMDGNETEDLSNVAVSVSGSSVTLKSVKNGDNGKQVRITGISVIYKAA